MLLLPSLLLVLLRYHHFLLRRFPDICGVIDAYRVVTWGEKMAYCPDFGKPCG